MNSSQTSGVASPVTERRPIIRKIEPITEQIEQDLNFTPRKLRVAAYARVSTEQDEQESSFEAQVNYYTSYIASQPNWEFVEVFADKGITGTNTKNRESFKRMMELALAGKIDLILTKSISRFARNTLDTLQAVRQLKAKGIEVIFEKENIHTLDPKCEMLLTIMSSLAQEESRSISENIRWAIQKNMENGKVNLPYKKFLGYRKGPDGRPEIVEEEAVIIRDIYEMFLSGWTIGHIARELTSRGIPTPAGLTTWKVSTIESILRNEKYKGEAILQKCYVEDYLTKRIKKNHGERPHYVVEQSHEPIIDPETFEKVQDLIAKRKAISHRLRDDHAFSSKLVCADCGRFYGHKVWRNKAGAYDVWYCNHRYTNAEKCHTPIFREPEIEEAFVKALAKIKIQGVGYTDALWREKVDQVIVHQDRRMQFHFKDGKKVEVRV